MYTLVDKKEMTQFTFRNTIDIDFYVTLGFMWASASEVISL